MLLASCGQQEINDNVMGDNTETIKLTDFVAAAKVTPIFEDSCYTVGEVLKVVKSKDAYLVLDHQRKSIVKYDYSGNPVYKINRVGRAKGEYVNINDFCIDAGGGDIILLCDPMKVIILDSIFNFKEAYNIDKYCQRVFSHEGVIYLYSDTKRSLCALEEGKLRTIIEEGSLPAMGFYPSPIFYQMNHMLLYSAVCSDCIYSVSNKTAQPFFKFTFKRKNQVYSKLKKVKPVGDWGIEELQEFSPLKIVNIFENNEEYIILYSYQFLIRCCRLDKNTHDIISDGILSTYSPLPMVSNGTPVIAADYMHQGKQVLDTLLYNENQQFHIDEEEMHTIIEYALK